MNVLEQKKNISLTFRYQWTMNAPDKKKRYLKFQDQEGHLLILKFKKKAIRGKPNEDFKNRKKNPRQIFRIKNKTCTN